MQSLVRRVFFRLVSLDPVVEEEKLGKSNEDTQEHEIKVDMQTLNVDEAIVSQPAGHVQEEADSIDQKSAENAVENETYEQQVYEPLAAPEPGQISNGTRENRPPAEVEHVECE